MYQLDKVDKEILEILKEDGRCSYSEIAKRVYLSRVAVGDRINNMIENDIIVGFTVLINAKACGKNGSVFMDIETEFGELESVAEELSKIEDITIVSQHTGTTGLHAHAYIDRLEELQSFLEREIYPIKGIRGITTEILIKQFKTNFYLTNE